MSRGTIQESRIRPPEQPPAHDRTSCVVPRSIISDVTSIRARPLCSRIAYRVVDECPEDWRYVPAPRTSRRPLSLAGLIRLIDTCGMVSLPGENLDLGGLALTANNCNAEDCGSREELRDFTQVPSPFYPQLHTHYETVFEDWVVKVAAQAEDVWVRLHSQRSPLRNQPGERGRRG